ncbi:addiction module protein [Wohlfahrtiimonas chitiniclastica]|uniref:protein adenylyltransferase Fic n=1 Tax=Wohlfahrtiimonas chitiniclastica TaxID=400946 RepID=UPI000B99499D|nr:Fic family protein [Wohlfahrtiimonas chitiniclastica]OYQ79000.1 addiction module protein [Wohlfahrtiimonas chitiniclastica]
MTWIANKPYNNLPLLPPNVDLETKEVLKACIKARSALAELNQAGKLLPNQGLLINLLPILEAQGSSEIENIVTTTDKLFQYADEENNADPMTKEALSYRRALYNGFQSLKDIPLCSRTAMDVCSTLKNSNMDVRKQLGTALRNSSNGEVIYTPPAGEETIRNLLRNWENFLHGSDDLDPLVKLAVLHYQFEAIHPFIDGNGRTGRILNILYLIEKELLTLPILYLSRYIVMNKNDYYRLLLDVTTKGQWESWILFMLRAVEDTSIWTKNKIAAVTSLIEETAQYIKEKEPKIYSYELVNILFEQPYCRISNLVDKDIAKRQTASTYLQKLCDLGVLTEYADGRDKLFINTKLIELMKN